MKIFGVIVTVALIAAVDGTRLTTGEVYKIISATNHTVLDVKDDKAFDGNIIIPWYWKETSTDNQLWVAEEVSPAVYVFSSVLDTKFALDASRKVDEELIIHPKHSWKNQQWAVEPVKINSFTFYIRSIYSNKVIELDADRQRVSLMPRNESNVNQRWIFADNI